MMLSSMSARVVFGRVFLARRKLGRCTVIISYYDGWVHGRMNVVGAKVCLSPFTNTILM